GCCGWAPDGAAGWDTLEPASSPDPTILLRYAEGRRRKNATAATPTTTATATAGSTRLVPLALPGAWTPRPLGGAGGVSVFVGRVCLTTGATLRGPYLMTWTVTLSRPPLSSASRTRSAVVSCTVRSLRSTSSICGSETYPLSPSEHSRSASPAWSC